MKRILFIFLIFLFSFVVNAKTTHLVCSCIEGASQTWHSVNPLDYTYITGVCSGEQERHVTIDIENKAIDRNYYVHEDGFLKVHDRLIFRSDETNAMPSYSFHRYTGVLRERKKDNLLGVFKDDDLEVEVYSFEQFNKYKCKKAEKIL